MSFYGSFGTEAEGRMAHPVVGLHNDAAVVDLGRRATGCQGSRQAGRADPNLAPCSAVEQLLFWTEATNLPSIIRVCL